MACIVNPDGTITCSDNDAASVMNATGVIGTVAGMDADALADAVRIQATTAGVPLVAILLRASDVAAAMKPK